MSMRPLNQYNDLWQVGRRRFRSGMVDLRGVLIKVLQLCFFMNFPVSKSMLTNYECNPMKLQWLRIIVEEAWHECVLWSITQLMQLQSTANPNKFSCAINFLCSSEFLLIVIKLLLNLELTIQLSATFAGMHWRFTWSGAASFVLLLFCTRFGFVQVAYQLLDNSNLMQATVGCSAFFGFLISSRLLINYDFHAWRSFFDNMSRIIECTITWAELSSFCGCILYS